MKIKTDFVTNSSSSSFIVVSVPDWFNTSVEEIKKIDILPMISIHSFTNDHLERLTKIVNEQINVLKKCETIHERDCLDEDTLDAYVITECVLDDFILADVEVTGIEDDGYIRGQDIKYLDEVFLNVHKNEFQKILEGIKK